MSLKYIVIQPRFPIEGYDVPSLRLVEFHAGSSVVASPVRRPSITLAPLPPQGPKGDKGDPGSTSQYIHNQGLAANEWVVNHGLGREVAAIRVTDTDNQPWFPDEVITINPNQIKIRFGNATFAGRAIII